MAGFKLKSQDGFTLIEVMVVLGIIAAMTAMIIPRMTNKNGQMKAAVRHLGVLAKETHIHSKLYGNTYRIVIDLGAGENADKDEPQSYWVEQSSTPYLLPEDRESIFKPKDEDEDEEETAKRPAFEPATRLMKEKKQLPGSLRFSQVEIAGLARPITSGLAYIHFFPQGRVEEAVIQLSIGEDLNWSLTLHPLTGKADIITKKISLKDINKE